MLVYVVADHDYYSTFSVIPVAFVDIPEGYAGEGCAANMVASCQESHGLIVIVVNACLNQQAMLSALNAFGNIHAYFHAPFRYTSQSRQYSLGNHGGY